MHAGRSTDIEIEKLQVVRRRRDDFRIDDRHAQQNIPFERAAEDPATVEAVTKLDRVGLDRLRMPAGNLEERRHARQSPLAPLEDVVMDLAPIDRPDEVDFLAGKVPSL